MTGRTAREACRSNVDSRVYTSTDMTGQTAREAVEVMLTQALIVYSFPIVRHHKGKWN